MAIVNVNPKDEAAPYLEEAGTYGPGLDHDATVEVAEFVSPNAEGLLINERDFNMMPGYDKEGAEGPYFFWSFKVTQANGMTCYVRAHTKSRRTRAWLKAAGVAVNDEADGTYSFDNEAVAGVEVGGVEVKAPRQSADGERWFSGDVKNVFAK